MKFPWRQDIIRITKETPYVTADPEELRYAGMQRFISTRDLDDKTFKNWVFNPNNRPDVLRVFKAVEDAGEFVWKDEYEDIAKEKLIANGYIKAVQDKAVSEAKTISDAEIEKVRQEHSEEVAALQAEVEAAKDSPGEACKVLTEQEIVEKAKQMGYVIYKKG